MDSNFRTLVIGVTSVLAALFASAAYVDGKRQDAAVRFVELALEAARASATHDERFAILCGAYASWVRHQNYQGEDLMRGHCPAALAQEAQSHD